MVDEIGVVGAELFEEPVGHTGELFAFVGEAQLHDGEAEGVCFEDVERVVDEVLREAGLSQRLEGPVGQAHARHAPPLCCDIH